MKKLLILLFVFKLTTGYSQDKGLDYKNINLGNFGWGIDLGGGYTLLEGNIKSYINNHASFNGGLFFSYKKITYDLRFLVGYSTAKNDFLGSKYYFRKDSANVIANIENSFGYMIFENEFFNFHPSLGFNIFQMGHTMEQDKSTDGPIKITPEIGVNLDYKFFRQNAETYLANIYIKTRITWIPFNYVDKLDGSQFNIGLSVGFYGRGIKN